MASRIEVKNPLDVVVDRAVEKAVNTMNQNMGITRASSLPPSITTTEGTNGEAVHPFIWGIDLFGDPNAVFTDKD
jgi:hypothetical protein